MQLMNECLKRAAHFARLAEAETDPKLKQLMVNQVDAYLRLAAKRAKELGVLPPSLPGKART
jgi:hypothetical protein